ncbi:MAG: hypothetical protein ACYDBS_05250 [Acidimicrobiales bacterium]
MFAVEVLLVTDFDPGTDGLAPSIDLLEETAHHLSLRTTKPVPKVAVLDRFGLDLERQQDASRKGLRDGLALGIPASDPAPPIPTGAVVAIPLTELQGDLFIERRSGGVRVLCCVGVPHERRRR